MGKKKKNDRRGTMHIFGSYVEIVGPKRKRGGTVSSPDQSRQLNAVERINWTKKVDKLISLLWPVGPGDL